MREKRADIKVLWLSRHSANSEQYKELERVFGKKIEIITISKSVKDAKEVINLMKEHNCDEIVAVLPFDIMVELLNSGMTIYRAKMERKLIHLSDGKDTAEFVFKNFQRIYLGDNIVIEDI